MRQTRDFTIPELLERLNAGQIPLTATAQVTFEEATPVLNGNNDPMLALFAQWEQEDAATPEQQAENKRIYAEIETNGIPRTRI